MKIKHSKLSDIVLDRDHYINLEQILDSYVVAAKYKGKQMSFAQIEALNNDKDFDILSLVFNATTKG